MKVKFGSNPFLEKCEAGFSCKILDNEAVVVYCE